MVPPEFRFSVKLFREFTHVHRLKSTEGLARTLSEVSELGAKFGVLLVQLPPSLFFDLATSITFFKTLRSAYPGPVALEPRHPSWLSIRALKLFLDFDLSLVTANPTPILLPDLLFQSAKMRYYRLHGTPVIYQSEYSSVDLSQWCQRITADPAPTVWCVFDNTALGHATKNALEFKSMIEDSRKRRIES